MLVPAGVGRSVPAYLGRQKSRSHHSTSQEGSVRSVLSRSSIPGRKRERRASLIGLLMPENRRLGRGIVHPMEQQTTPLSEARYRFRWHRYNKVARNTDSNQC